MDKENEAAIKQKTSSLLKNKLEESLFRKSLLSSKDKHGLTKGQQESFLMSDIENFAADSVSAEKVPHARIFTFRSSHLEDRARIERR